MKNFLILILFLIIVVMILTLVSCKPTFDIQARMVTYRLLSKEKVQSGPRFIYISRWYDVNDKITYETRDETPSFYEVGTEIEAPIRK